MPIKQKFRVPEIFLGALLAGAFFGMGMMFQASRHSPRSETSNPPSQQIAVPHKPEPFSWDWLTHDGVAFFTCLLAMVAVGQAGLFVWQLRYMKLGLKDTGDAALAAKLNAEALVGSERARVYVVVEDQSFREVIHRAAAYDHPTSADMRVSPSTFKYRLKDYGKSPAIIQQVAHGLLIAADLPSTRNCTVQIPLTIEEILGAGETSAGCVEVALPSMLVGDAVAIQRSEKSIWFYGELKYHDTFQVRTLHFRFLYNGITQGGFRNLQYRETEEDRQT